MTIVAYNQQSIQKIADLLKRGDLVSLPTDTLYALCANATSDEAVQKVFNAKHRMLEKALPIFVDSIEMARNFVEFDDISLRLAEHYWPGMLTIVLPLKEGSAISSVATGGRGNVGVRVPASPPVLEVIAALKAPLTGTSVNYSGEPALNSAQEIAENFQSLAAVLDHPLSQPGAAPSTIVEVINGKLEVHRVGAIAVEDILKLTSVDLS